jgi:hypothetical protein
MKNFTPEKIEKILKAHKVTPRKEWQEQMLSKIRSLEDDKQNKYMSFFNTFIMKKLISGVVAVMVIAVGFGYFYTTNTPYAKAQAHLQNIQTALTQLEGYVATNQVSTVQTSALFPVAYADVSTDATIAQLVQKIHDESDATLTEAEKIENAETIAELLAEITKMQNEIVKVYSDVLDKVKDETLTNTLSSAIEDTANTTKVVDEALDNARQALKEKRKEFKAEIVAKVKELRATKEEDRLQSSEDLLKALGTDPANMTEGMQEKYDTLKAILATCDKEGEKCQSGKAHGLAVALTAQVRNQSREKEHENEDKNEDNQYGYDDKNEDKDSVKFQKEQEKEQNKQEMEKQKEEYKNLKEQEKQKIEAQKESEKAQKEQEKQEMEKQREDAKNLKEQEQEQESD